MVIHVESDGTAMVPVEMNQQDLAGSGGSYRPGGVEWNTHESKVLLEHYVKYVPQVGPDKKFRSKKEMFKRIADQIYEATGQRRTGEQCENRYKTIMRRKRRHSDLPTLSTARFLLRNAIAADTENHQMEEEEVEEELLEEGEVRAEHQAEEGGDPGGEEEGEEDGTEPQLLLELAAMGDEEHQLARRTSRRRAANTGLDQQQLLDRLHELHERRERRRDERERRRDLRHAEQMNLLRRILSVLEQPTTATTTTPTHVRVLSASHR